MTVDEFAEHVHAATGRRVQLRSDALATELPIDSIEMAATVSRLASMGFDLAPLFAAADAAGMTIGELVGYLNPIE